VLGHSLAPLGETDYSAHLLAAASSGAQAVGIAAGGSDFVNIVKQMGEFGLTRRGIVPAALNCTLSNIHALGLAAAQGMIFSQPYYWDHDVPSRAFAARFAKQFKDRPPTAFQASTWGAVTHYLKAIQAAGTDAAGPVMEKMRATPINDFMTKDGKLRIDGTVVREMFLLRAKTPAQSHSEWDLLEVAEIVPGAEAFRPLQDGGCPLVKA
jgi:branched-chain amino acid transport system substrate-binding protein